MPLEAFDTLNKQKKQAIISSALNEFSRYPYDRASIFNIAKNAGVSRSGLYYYFSDKEDIYSCLLSELCDELEKGLEGEISVFELPNKIFLHFAQYKGKEKQNFIFRVIENMKPAVQDFFALNITKHEFIKKRIKLKDVEMLKLNSDVDLQFLAFIVVNCVVFALKSYYDTDIALEVIQDKLNKRFNCIKYGIIKEDHR